MNAFRLARLLGASAAAFLAITAANAQSAYPNRPVRLIVPYQAGGSTDSVIRKFAEMAAPKLGQPIIIENKGGAGATMGAQQIATAKADGYTLAILPSPVFRMPHIQNVGYDPNKDFTYIMMLSGYTLGVAVKQESPYKTWEDLIAAAMKTPEKITYGTASLGSASNVMMEQIAEQLGVKWRHVPYQGETGVLQAVLGDFVDVYAGSSTVLPMVNSGKMRMLVTWGSERSKIYPGTRTLQEIEKRIPPVYAPFGIAGPKGLPEDVLARLTAAFKSVVDSDDFKKVLLQYGQEPVYMDGAMYAKYASMQYAEEAKIVKQLGLANK